MKIYLLNIKRAVAALCVVLSGINLAVAHDFEAGGIFYDILSADDRTCAVTFKGETATSVSGETEYNGDVIIPSSVDFESVKYSVIQIKTTAFKQCINLTSIFIPESVKSIGTSAFQDCSGLTEIVIPDGVSILNGVFSGCSGLLSVTIPATVETIGDFTFKNCTSLETIKVLRATPPTIKSSAFSGANLNAVLEVPSESVVSYQEADYWKNFSEIKGIELNNGTPTSIETMKAENCGVVEYYNILGVKVENPTKGLYIKKCGNKAYKVML